MFKVDCFEPLPHKLQMLWSNIPPDIENIANYLAPLKVYLKENFNKGDIALIQGDFGATCHMVRFIKELEGTPIYATTERKVKEYVDGGKVIRRSIFEHVRFRKYL